MEKELKNQIINDYKTSEDLCCLLKDNVGSNLGSSHAKFVDKNIKDYENTRV